MYNLNAYLKLYNGNIQNYHCRTEIKQLDDISAVYIEGFSKDLLDADFGVAIEIQIDNVDKWMANYRHSEYWCRPEFGVNLSEIPDETQALVYKKKNGKFGVILPVVSEKYKCVLKGEDNNLVLAKLFSWYKELNSCNALAFLYMEGNNPYEMLAKCVATGLKLLNTGCRSRDERRYPAIFEYLGWCSWDALEIRVTEEDLIKKCEEFKNKNIPVKWIIIDDMWAEVKDFYNMSYATRSEMFRLMHSSKLYSFKADPFRFPNGLKTCIDKIKEYGITVGMWHPTTGYWMGIDPEGEIYKDYKDYLIKTSDGRHIPDYRQDKAYMFYNAFHEFLRRSGAEFVKIDNQSMTRRFYKGLAPVGDVARQYHNAIEASVGQHFDNQMINCMGMASEDMWNRSVSPISRCSDDFLPENKEWFAKHILQCSFNCLVQGQFYYCDWDMWWTDDRQAVKNSILRAVSGGPIYISDMPDRSNGEILLPLMLENGKLLRCDRPGMPSIDCITENPLSSGNIFKIQNVCGDSGVIAVFNLDDNNNAVTGKISPTDVDGLNGDEFAVYEHFSREMKILKYNESFNITLKDSDDFKLYVIVPIINGFASIGRTDKFISPKTIKWVKGNEIELVEEGEYAFVENGKLIIKAV